MTVIEQASSFLQALFTPSDLILFRPIETWTELGRKKSRVDYDGIRYERFGLRAADGSWVWWPGKVESTLSEILTRAEAESTNIFFGTCPRHGADGRYDLAWQIRTVRTLWCDVDNATPDEVQSRIESAGLPAPSVLVHSGNGCHVYWLLNTQAEITDTDVPQPVHTEWQERTDHTSGAAKKKRKLYLTDPTTGEHLSLDARQNIPELSPQAQAIQDILAGIAAKIGGDHTQDLSRILRIPGTWNRKDQRNGRAPVPCSLIHCDPSRRYPLEQFAGLAATSPAKARREKIAQVPLPSRRRLTTKREDRLNALIADCAAAEIGVRSDTDYALCCYAVEVGMDQAALWAKVSSVGKFAEAGERYFRTTWAAACSNTREKIFDEAKKKARRKASEKSGQPAPPSPDLKPNEADDDPHRLARLYLERYHNHKDHGPTLCYWRDEWWAWAGNRYTRSATASLRSKVGLAVKQEFDRLNIEALQNDPGDDKPPQAQKVTRTVVSNVMAALESLSVIPDATEPMSWLDGRPGQRASIAMANGLLDMDKLLAGQDDCLQPHTPVWFSPVCLSYAFNPAATCETWTRTLYHNLEQDGERIALLQEWFGYLLLPDTSQQKFLVCEGEGSNGKSVVCAVLEAMLGQENVSHVPLEIFGQRFQLTPTLGKLANISADVGELEKTAEGFLKSYTGGDMMTFDRKGLPPIDATPTARLTIAANNRPRFSDRSSGLWRRMMVIPFRVEIGERDRIVGMDKPTWWINSGELSGIFNWAVAGLYRLRKQGRFTQPKLSQEALADYRIESNPARGFLEEYCDANSMDSVSSQDLYDAYKTWCGRNGYRPLGEKIFGKEVKRVFPNVEKRKLGPRGDRFYAYQGVTFFADKF